MTETAESYLRASIARVPFHQWLKPEVARVDDAAGKVTIRLALRPDFRRDAAEPSPHGGVIAALVDIAAHAAVAAKLRRGLPTIDLRVDYLRMTTSGALNATGELVKLGRTISVADVRVIDDDGKLIATGRAVFATGPASTEQGKGP